MDKISEKQKLAAKKTLQSLFESNNKFFVLKFFLYNTGMIFLLMAINNILMSINNANSSLMMNSNIYILLSMICFLVWDYFGNKETKLLENNENIELYKISQNNRTKSIIYIVTLVIIVILAWIYGMFIYALLLAEILIISKIVISIITNIQILNSNNKVFLKFDIYKETIFKTKRNIIVQLIFIWLIMIAIIVSLILKILPLIKTLF